MKKNAKIRRRIFVLFMSMAMMLSLVTWEQHAFAEEPDVEAADAAVGEETEEAGEGTYGEVPDEADEGAYGEVSDSADAGTVGDAEEVSEVSDWELTEEVPVDPECLGDKTITGLGTGAISNPDRSETGSWCYVYYGWYVWDNYGHKNATVLKYRVLSKNTSDFGVQGGSLFLDCDGIIYQGPFNKAGYYPSNNIDTKYWNYSDIRRDLNGDGFLTKAECFTDVERDAIAESVKPSIPSGESKPNQYWKYAPLNGERIFLIDGAEAKNPAYGYSSQYYNQVDSGRTKYYQGKAAKWWLRSCHSSSEAYACIIHENGYMNFEYTAYKLGVSPAFNVKLSSILFSSLVKGKAGEKGSEYKLTLLDKNLAIKPRDSGFGRSGRKLTVPYIISGKNAKNATQVSILVTDKAYSAEGARVLQYGKLSTDGNFKKKGIGAFTLSSGISGKAGKDYHLYMIAEDVNGSSSTDYASTPVDISNISQLAQIEDDSKKNTDKDTATMFRLYNPNSGEHFYTASLAEGKNLIVTGWNYEGIAWFAPKKSKTPVYRLYNPNAGDHHYTMSVTEKNSLVKAGWNYEGIGWYSDDKKGTPLYRLYNPNAVTGAHHYTVSAKERDSLVSVGWKDEGIGWYGR